jgi:hypothetical protein
LIGAFEGGRPRSTQMPPDLWSDAAGRGGRYRGGERVDGACEHRYDGEVLLSKTITACGGDGEKALAQG